MIAWSRDGVHWERHPERPLFLETGPPGSYDWGMVFVFQGLPVVDDRVYIYYQGDEAFHIGADVKENRTGNLCLATLRRDGFVSLDATAEGYMLTRPLFCPGGRLHINARTAPDGFVRVAVRRGDGGGRRRLAGGVELRRRPTLYRRCDPCHAPVEARRHL